jgi:hypothetical protein
VTDARAFPTFVGHFEHDVSPNYLTIQVSSRPTYHTRIFLCPFSLICFRKMTRWHRLRSMPGTPAVIQHHTTTRMKMCRSLLVLQFVWSLSTVFLADAYTSPIVQNHNLHAGRLASFAGVVDATGDSSSIAVLNGGPPNEVDLSTIEESKYMSRTPIVPSKKDLVTGSVDQGQEAEQNDNESNEENSKGAFELVSNLAAACLWESDMRRDAKGLHAGLQASSATNWINDATAFALQKSVDKIKLKVCCQEVSRCT